MSIKALVLNCSLKDSTQKSNTRALINEIVKIFDENRVETEVLRMADYNIGFGVTHEAVNEKDQWPEIFEKVKKADILLLGSPICLVNRAAWPLWL